MHKRSADSRRTRRSSGPAAWSSKPQSSLRVARHKGTLNNRTTCLPPPCAEENGKNAHSRPSNPARGTESTCTRSLQFSASARCPKLASPSRRGLRLSACPRGPRAATSTARPTTCRACSFLAKNFLSAVASGTRKA